MCKNWGSVAGGSFLNAFFGPFDLVSEMFRVKNSNNFSAIQEETVRNVRRSIVHAAAVITSSNLSGLMLIRT